MESNTAVKMQLQRIQEKSRMPKKWLMCFQTPRFWCRCLHKTRGLLSNSMKFLSFLLVFWCHHNLACPKDFLKPKKNPVFCLDLSELLCLTFGHLFWKIPPVKWEDIFWLLSEKLIFSWLKLTSLQSSLFYTLNYSLLQINTAQKLMHFVP